MLVFQQLAYLSYWSSLFLLVHLWDFVARVRLFLSTIFCDRQNLCVGDYHLGSNKTEKSNPAPRHIAFHLDDPRYVNEEFVCSLIRHCANAGICRLTLSDSCSLLSSSSSNAALVQNGKNGVVDVRRLANDDGRAVIVRACKELSLSQLPVSTQQLLDTVLLLTDSDEQLDFLVRVGGPVFWQSAILAAHTPLAIRTTEFHCVDAFSNDQLLSDQEFRVLLDQFSTRSRRFGR